MTSTTLMCVKDETDMEQVSGKLEIGLIFRCPKCKNEVILTVVR